MRTLASMIDRAQRRTGEASRPQAREPPAGSSGLSCRFLAPLALRSFAAGLLGAVTVWGRFLNQNVIALER